MELFDYQKDAVQFIRENKRVILNLDTGLGKTITAIKSCSIKDTKVLVIAPTFLCSMWQTEIGKHASRNWFTVKSYYEAQTEVLELAAAKYDAIIIDEAHYLKNWSAKRTRTIIRGLTTKIPNVLFLTATPIVNCAADLHPLLSSCAPGKFGTFKAFADKYCFKQKSVFAPSGYKYIGVRNGDELKTECQDIIFTRTKEQVEFQLPDKLDTNIWLDWRPDNGSNPRYAFLDEDNGSRIIERIEQQDPSLAYERRVIGLNKISAIVEWLNNTHACVVVYTWHRDVADAIYNHKDLDRIRLLITGATPVEQRDESLKAFEEIPGQVLIATIGSLGVGVNLQHCSDLIFAELPWTYADMKQCEDRLHRIGQKKCVNIYRFLISQSLDAYMWKVVQKKKETSAILNKE